MNVLIVGYGQIGRSIEDLYVDTLNTYTDLNNTLDLSKANKEQYSTKSLTKVYKPGVEIFKIDFFNTLEGLKEPSDGCSIDLMHICYGYNDKFISSAEEYIKKYKPEMVIINSTVQVGTTRELIRRTNANIVHSPVMGVHPHLTESMLTFTKIIGSIDKKAFMKAKYHFQSLGIKTVQYNSPEESEAAKLLDTSYYGWNILFMKHVHKYCVDKKLDFENVYTTTNEIYNEGYKKMKMPNVVRPVLKYMPGRIGGHCIMPNYEILKHDFYPAKIGLVIDEDESL